MPRRGDQVIIILLHGHFDRLYLIKPLQVHLQLVQQECLIVGIVAKKESKQILKLLNMHYIKIYYYGVSNIMVLDMNQIKNILD